MKLLLYILAIFSTTFGAFGQITSIGHTGIIPTAYTDGRAPDNIYVFCGTEIGQRNGKLTGSAPINTTGPFTFTWSYYNEAINNWTLLSTETGTTSTIDNLPSDGYRLLIKDINGTNISCSYAWVYNMNIEGTASNNRTACNATNLTGTLRSENSFIYYNIPPDESIIKADTEISICFSAQHTYVSDLAFYLKAPNGTRITLSHNPGVLGQGSVCNSGDNVSNLCFTNTSTSMLNICTASTPLSGTYGRYYGPNGGIPIDWSPLLGIDAAAGGWAVQIYDCINSDRGALTNATISFSNLDTRGGCNAQENITYSSGSINSAINDNSCSEATASIFQVPLPTIYTSPITLNATTSNKWTASNPIPAWAANGNTASGTSVAVTDIPSGSTTFSFHVSIKAGDVECDEQIFNTNFENQCCTATVNVLKDSVTICPGTPTLLESTVNGNRYSWSPSIGLNNDSLAQPTLTLDNSSTSMENIWYVLTVFDDDNECEKKDSILVKVIGHPNITIPELSCMEVEYDIFATSYKGGTWEMVGTEPNTLNLDSFLYLLPLESNQMGIRVGEAGKYIMEFTDSVCGLKSQKTIDFKPYVWTSIQDTAICVNSTYKLQAWVPPYPVKFSWNTGSTDTLINISEIGTYYVTVSNECFSYTDSAIITNKICDIETPNIISLSSTVGNNIWYVRYEGITTFDCYIVDRWGNNVYHFDEVTGYWNGKNSAGKKVNEGVYFFTIIAKTEGQQEVKKQGFIEVKH